MRAAGTGNSFDERKPSVRHQQKWAMRE